MTSVTVQASVSTPQSDLHFLSSANDTYCYAHPPVHVGVLRRLTSEVSWVTPESVTKPKGNWFLQEYKKENPDKVCNSAKPRISL